MNQSLYPGDGRSWSARAVLLLFAAVGEAPGCTTPDGTCLRATAGWPAVRRGSPRRAMRAVPGSRLRRRHAVAGVDCRYRSRVSSAAGSCAASIAYLYGSDLWTGENNQALANVHWAPLTFAADGSI